MFTAAEVAARLQAQGQLPDGPSPRALAQIDDMAEKVMSYLNSNGVPDGLFRTFCRLCAAYIQSSKAGTAAGGEVRSVSEGDVTVAFSTAAESARTSADGLLSDYAPDLNRYRSAYPRKEESPWQFQRT